MRLIPCDDSRVALSTLAATLAVTLLSVPAVPDDRQGTRPTFGAESEVVLLDLVARGRDGRPVTNLREKDLTVFEDGKPCEIVSFRFVGAASRVAGAASPSPAAASEPGVAGPAPHKPGTPSRANLVVVVFDRLIPETAPYARKGGLELVSSHFPPDTWIAVYYNGILVQPFTTDKDRLKVAVEKATSGWLRWRELLERPNPLETARTPGVEQMTRPGPPPDALPNLRAALARRTVAENATLSRVSALDTLYPLIGISEALRPFNARKSIIYIATGWQFGTSIRGVYDELVSAANRSNTTIHTVDARGLEPQHLGFASAFDAVMGRMSASSGDSGGLGGPQEFAHLNATEPTGIMSHSTEGMEDMLSGPRIVNLAWDTGGHAINNTNDLGAGLAQVVEELEQHYEVVYLPPNPVKDGRFRHVRVKVARRGVQVRTRAGYFASADDTPKLSSQDLPLLEAIGDEGATSSFPLEAGVLQPGTKGQDRESLILAEVPVGAMLRDVDDDALLGQPAHLRLLGHVTGAHGEVVARLVRDWPTQPGLLLGQLQTNPSANVVFKTSLPLRPGQYGLAIAVEDTVTGHTSVARRTFEVPEPSNGLTLSSLSVLRQVERAGARGGAPLKMGDLSLYPNLSSKIPLSAASAVPIYVSVSPNEASPPVELTIEIRAANQVVGHVTATLGAPGPDGQIPWVGTLQMAGLTPGEYEITARARQGKHTAETHTTVELVAGDADPSDDPPGL
jgi:VWFA-related protein